MVHLHVCCQLSAWIDGLEAFGASVCENGIRLSSGRVICVWAGLLVANCGFGPAPGSHWGGYGHSLEGVG